MKPDYTRSIVNVTASILRHYELDHPHPSLKTLDTVLDDPSIRHVVLVVLDGLGVNMVQRSLPEQGLFRHQQLDQVTSVFPSTTAAATTAILTGYTPYESGFLGWFQYFRQYDTHYTIFLGEDYYHPQKAIHRDFQKLFERETFLDRVRKAHDTINTTKLFPYPIEKDGYHSVNEALERVLAKTYDHDQSLTYLYMIEPDITAHRFGATSDDTKTMITQLNDVFSAIKPSLKKDTAIIITADHGLTDVEGVSLLDKPSITETFAHLPAIEPRATTFFIKEGMHQQFETQFKKYFGESFTLMSKVDFLHTGLLGHGHKHPFVDLCLGDYMAIADSNKYLELSTDKSHKGHHAGVSEDEMLVPVIFFRGEQ